MVMRNCSSYPAGHSKPHTTIITGNCRMCGERQFLEVLTWDWRKFLSADRIYIQHLFPYLLDHDRELLISGICRKCWEIATKTEEDEGE